VARFLDHRAGGMDRLRCGGGVVGCPREWAAPGRDLRALVRRCDGRPLHAPQRIPPGRPRPAAGTEERRAADGVPPTHARPAIAYETCHSEVLRGISGARTPEILRSTSG
jgi:hypothetical protein